MKPWMRRIAWVAGTFAVTYGMIYADVVLRARSAYLQGEQYSFWADHPAEHVRYLDQKFSAERATLEARKAQAKISPDDYDRDAALLEFDHAQALKESSLKYAYVWYQTAAVLFSPPDSRWVRLARQKMPVVKERWKAELRAQNIAYQDYMID